MKTHLLFIIILATVKFIFAWEFIGPKDSMAVSQLYCFGKGHIIAFEGETNGTFPRVFRSRDYGITWDTIKNNGLPASSVFAWVTWYNNELWTGIGSEGIFTSSDSGNSWKRHPTYGKNTPGCFVAKDSIFITGSQGDLQKSTNYGKTWEYGIQISCLPDPTVVKSLLSAMEFRNVIYFGTMYGVFASKDWGKTWEKRGLNYSNTEGAWISSLARIDTVFLMSSYAALYRSYNLGLNENGWLYTFDTQYSTFLYIMDSSQIYVRDTYIGKTFFYYSVDTGKTYQSFIASNPETPCNAIRSDDKYVYIMGWKGIYRNLKTDSPTTINNNSTIKKDRSILISQFANIIILSIKKSTSLDICLFKPNGQKVFYYKNKQVPEGQFTIDLKKYTIGSGLYLLKILSFNKNKTIAVYIK